MTGVIAARVASVTPALGRTRARQVVKRAPGATLATFSPKASGKFVTLRV